MGELNLAKSSLHLSSHERDAYKSHYHKSSLACAAWNITIVGSLFKCQGEPTIFLCLCVTGGWTQIQNGHPWSAPSQPIWRGDSQQGGYEIEYKKPYRFYIVCLFGASPWQFFFTGSNAKYLLLAPRRAKSDTANRASVSYQMATTGTVSYWGAEGLVVSRLAIGRRVPPLLVWSCSRVLPV